MTDVSNLQVTKGSRVDAACCMAPGIANNPTSYSSQSLSLLCGYCAAAAVAEHTQKKRVLLGAGVGGGRSLSNENALLFPSSCPSFLRSAVCTGPTSRQL